MSKKMLIDASHEEETRVVVMDGSRVEDLDFESSAKRQLRGNVYLARVTRVEPSLQAAFIEYGGNRHGFLAFPEIHPDYYQIPYEDRQALQAEEEELAREADEADDDDVEEDENLDPDADDTSDENDAEVASEQVKVASTRRKRISKRRYKIQEVIKRGQILLVQAVKEERGNKGAAMTTYLSLAGRYCVLMPNTPRGGGISRKIASQTDRKRLKSIMNNLDVPSGIGVIVRTAGAKKTKVEIKRDYDYLMNLWDDIRETTMQSTAPALIHEEGNLVKRSLRDLYGKDVSEVLIEGEEAYKSAKAFINLLMPSHADNVKQYDGDLPLFLEYGAEKQLEASLDATVQLKSGGYLVIHPTEALVSIDVNSGRSTKERNVERTALKTNLEAADEVCRQMRMRDLAGLIVIDFIDMDESKNNRAVEKRMKDGLARDRARVQHGKISQFGLMEISRQRRRRSLLEGSTAVCRHCDGVGRKRTVESSALKAIRGVEEIAARGKAARVKLVVADDVANYLLNDKRDLLVDVEKRLGTFTEVVPSDSLIRPHFELEVTEKGKGRDRIADAEKARSKEQEEARKAAKAKPKEEPEEEDDEAETVETRAADDDEDKPKRRRRGRRGGRGRRKSSEDTAETATEDDAAVEAEADKPDADSESAPKRSRRRRAPGKSKAAEAEASDAAEELVDDNPASDAEEAPAKPRSAARRRAPSRTKDAATEDAATKPPRKRRAPAKAADKAAEAEEDGAKFAMDVDVSEEAPEAKPKAGTRRKAPAKTSAKASAKATADTEAKPTRKRRAPAKASGAETVEAEDAPKPARKRRAPAKAVAADVEEAEVVEADVKPARKRRAPAKAKADAEDAPKPTRKRRAPAKAKAELEADATGETDSKPVRKRRAPAKAKAEVAETQAEAPVRKRRAPAKAKAEAPSEPAAEDAPKPVRKRRAPAKAKTDTIPEVGEAVTKPTRRKAPAMAKSDAELKAKAAEGLPEEMAPDQVSVAKAKAPAKAPAKRGRAKAAPKAEKPRKKGWWNRMMGE